MWANQMWKDYLDCRIIKTSQRIVFAFPKKLIWIYGVEQPDLFETIRKIWFPRQCEFINGFPEDLLTHLEQMSDHGGLCIFDVMNEVSSNSMVSKLFTHGRSHLGCINVAKHIPKRHTE